jgi:DNA polymerase (family 10)
MDRHTIAHALEEMAGLLELRGENTFKVRAFQNAARTVEDFPGDLAAAVASGEFAGIKGIGPGTLEVVRECLASGRSSALESLRAEVPAGLVTMLRISGMGSAKVRAVHDQLGITSLDALEAAARDGRLAALKGFGAKTAAKILRGVEFLRRTAGLRLVHHGDRQAARLVEAISALPGVERVQVAGDLRRRCEVIRDLDLVAVVASARADSSTADRADGPLAGTSAILADALVRTGAATATLAADAAGFRVQLEGGATATVACAAPGQSGHTLVWATGSRSHLDLLERRAAERGLTLDAAGLRRTGAVVPCPDEEAFYSALGLAWIPPELREGADEVARAAAGPLPRLVERGDLRGLLHCHTNYSDGTNSVAELAEACRALGYAWLGITDHSVAAAYAGGLNAARVAQQHAEIDAWNRASAGPRILKGVEADILADGQLDYGADVLGRFDFVIGSVHSRFDLDVEAMTARVLRAMDDPRLTILGHPTGRLLLTRDPYPIDMHQVIARAAERGVAIEINADPQRLDLDWRLCREARDAGVAISIGPDAHSLAGLANVGLGIGIARKGWLRAEDVLNTKDTEGFAAYAKRRR